MSIHYQMTYKRILLWALCLIFLQAMFVLAIWLLQPGDTAIGWGFVFLLLFAGHSIRWCYAKKMPAKDEFTGQDNTTPPKVETYEGGR